MHTNTPEAPRPEQKFVAKFFNNSPIDLDKSSDRCPVDFTPNTGTS